MTTVVSRTFTTDSNYIKSDSNKIGAVSGSGTLKLYEDIVDFTEDCTDDTGWDSYDSTLEFSGGKIQQINYTPTDAVLYSAFTNDLNTSWSDGTATATTYGSPTVSGGEAVFSGNAAIEYSVNNFTALGQTGCIRRRMKFGYTGSAPSTQYLLQTSPNIASRVYLVHNGGYIQCYINNSAGATLFSMVYAYSATANATVEFEINWNATTGHAYLFENGVLKDSDTGTGTINPPTLYRIGQGSNANFKVLDELVFSTVQHTSGYTPNWSSIYETRFLAGKAVLPEMIHENDGVIHYGDSLTTIEGSGMRMSIEVGRSGTKQYWNGSIWDTSSDSYATACSSSDFDTNFSTLDVEGEQYGQFTIYFPAQNTQGYLDNLIASMDIDLYDTNNPWIKYNDTTWASEITNFLATISATGSDAVRFALEIGGSDYYITGSTLTASTGYAQTNTAAEVLTEISLWITARSQIRWKIYLHSEDGSTTPTIDLLTFNIDDALPDVNPTLIDIDLFAYLGSSGYEDYVIKYRPYNTVFTNEGVVYFYAWKTVTPVIADGTVSFPMPKNPSGTFWEMKAGGKSIKFTLENVSETHVDLSTISYEVLEDE